MSVHEFGIICRSVGPLISWLSGDDMPQLVRNAKAGFGKPFFMEVALNIWKIRNALIFRQERPSFVVRRMMFIYVSSRAHIVVQIITCCKDLAR